MDLVFVTNRSQVESLAAAPDRPFERLRPVTANPSVAECLRRLGVPFVDEWDFLTPADISRNSDEARVLASAWWDESLAPLTYTSFSLAEAQRFENTCPFEICLNANTIYERILQQFPHSRLFAFRTPRAPLTRKMPPPLIRESASLAQAVLRWLAEQADRPLQFLDCHRPPVPEGLNHSVPGHRYPVSLTANAPATRISPSAELTPQTPGHVLWTHPPAPRHAGDSASAATDRVALLVVNLHNETELVAIEQAFHATPGWRTVRVRAHECSPVKSKPWHDTATARKLKQAWRALPAFQAKYTGPYPALFANRYLRFQFRRQWREMLRAARIGQSFSTLLDELRPDVAVFAHESFVLERTMVRVAKGRGIPTVALIHGGLRPVVGYRGVVGDADHVFLWWQRDAVELARFGVAPERLSVIGSLRYNRPGATLPAPRSQAERARRQLEARRLLKIPTDRPVISILTAAVNHGLASHVSPMGAQRQAFYELVELARRHPEYTFITKPHPGYDHFDFYRQLQIDAPSNYLLRETDALDLVVNASDVAAMVNYCTTAALEAMFRDVPVIFLQTATYESIGRTDSLSDQPVPRLPTVADFEQRLAEIIAQPDLQDALIEAGRSIVKSATGIGSHNSVPEFLSEIEQLVANRPASQHTEPAAVSVTCRDLFLEAATIVSRGGNHLQLLPACRKILQTVCADPAHSPEVIQTIVFRIACELGRARGSDKTLHAALAACDEVIAGDPRCTNRDRRLLRLNARNVRTAELLRQKEQNWVSRIRRLVHDSQFRRHVISRVLTRLTVSARGLGQRLRLL
ncbi:MAG: hypothetical protein JSS02_22170 [Planctomycetes bacterium]|nr:hypothetical protein [Planctomycetota bacterium]